MGDEQHGAAAEVFHQVEGNAALGFVVQSAGGFVHDQQAGVLQHGAGDGDALALAAAEAAAALTHGRGVAAGQPHDEVVCTGNPGGGDDVIAAGLRVGEGNVVLHRALEEEGVLGHDADLAAQGVKLHLGDIGVVDQDATRQGVIEARQQLGEGGLAGAGLADDGHELTGG